MSKIGVFGGSFDPIHYGHLILAEQCREQARLDQVLFVPASISPLKQRNPMAADKHRLEMLLLAIAGHSNFQVCTLELERQGVSYTVDTLIALTSLYPPAELFLLIGQDSLQTFRQWKQPETICRLAIPLVCRRPGIVDSTESPMANLETLKAVMEPDAWQRATELAIRSRCIEISSTEIRNRTSNRQTIRYLVPRAVEKYIETNRLYQTCE